MKSSEIWFRLLMTCFLIHVAYSNNHQYGSSRIHRKNQKVRESAKKVPTLSASAHQLQTSASSPDIVHFLQYLNKSKVLNIGNINDVVSNENNGRSDVLTLAIPMSALKSLEDGVFTGHEISLSDLNKLTEDIQRLGITVNEFDEKTIDSIHNPTDINQSEVPFDNRQLIQNNAGHDYSRTNGNENSFERNQHSFQGYQQDQINHPPVSYNRNNMQNTAVDRDTFLSRGTTTSDSAESDLYARTYRPSISKQPMKFSNEDDSQRQNIFKTKNVEATNSDEYHTIPKENSQLLNKNRLIASDGPIRKGETNSNDHLSTNNDTNFPQRYQQHYAEHKQSFNNGNFQNRETDSGLHQTSHNDQSNSAKNNKFSNRHQQSTVSYLPELLPDRKYSRKTVDREDIHQSNNAANELPTNLIESTIQGNAIINRIGETGVDLPQNVQETAAQGNYKGDDGTGRFGSIPGIWGVDYPNYSSIPRTGFDCRLYNYPGYFADIQAQCQVYHICQADGRYNSFLCPVGTLFNQKVLVCDWWYNIDCASSDNYFGRNAYLHQESITASNNKGYHQSNRQPISIFNGHNLKNTESTDRHPEIADQNLNLLNDVSEMQGENFDLSDERSGRSLRGKTDWRDNINNFAIEPTAKYISEGNVISNDNYFPLDHSDNYRTDRMEQSVNSFNDVSETRDRMEHNVKPSNDFSETRDRMEHINPSNDFSGTRDRMEQNTNPDNDFFETRDRMEQNANPNNDFFETRDRMEQNANPNNDFFETRDRTEQNINRFNDVSEMRNRMEHNIKPSVDASKTGDESSDSADERRRNNQKNNNWEVFTNVFSKEPARVYVPEENFAIQNDKFLPLRQNVNNKPIESFSVIKEGKDRSFDRNFDLWIPSNTNGKFEDHPTPSDENVLKPQENAGHNEYKYDISSPAIESRIDEVVRKESASSVIEENDERLGKLITSQVNHNKLQANQSESEEIVKSNEGTKVSSLYESNYFEEREETKEDDFSEEELPHTVSQTDATQNENVFKLKNNVMKSKENWQKDKDWYRNSVKQYENDDKTEEELEDYDEKSQMEDEIKKDIVSEEVSFESNEDALEKDLIFVPEGDPELGEYGKKKKIDRDSIHVINPISSRDASLSGRKSLLEDGNISMTTVSSNSENKTTISEPQNSQVRSHGKFKMGEGKNNPYVSPIGVSDQKRADEQQKDAYRNLETFHTTTTAKPGPEIDETNSILKEIIVEAEGKAEKDKIEKDDFVKVAPEIKELDNDEIRSKIASLSNGARDILTELASGDRLYKNIFISEVLSPHYRNIQRNDQRYHSPTMTDRSADIDKSRKPQNDKLASSETSSIIRVEKNPLYTKKLAIRKDFTDSVVDAAESRLIETVRKPHAKTFPNEEVDGGNYRRIHHMNPRNSAEKRKSRFKETAKRQMSRRKRYQLN